MQKNIKESDLVLTMRHTLGRKFFLLFLFLLGYLVSYPYLLHGIVGYVSFRVLAIGMTIFSVYAVSFRRSLVLIALALAIPDFLRHSALLQTDASLLSLWNTSFTFCFDAFIIVVIFRRVFFYGRPDSETIFGALCIYLLLGFTFANIYGLIAIAQPHAFYLDPTTNFRTVPNHFDLLYYSFGTLTALGANGMMAISDQARSLSVIESMLGVLYLAVLIARLMSGYRIIFPRD